MYYSFFVFVLHRVALFQTSKIEYEALFECFLNDDFHDEICNHENFFEMCGSDLVVNPMAIRPQAINFPVRHKVNIMPTAP